MLIKKKKIWAKLTAAISVAAMLISPVTVSADMSHIQTYQELKNHPGGLAYFSPAANLGWPKTATTVNVLPELRNDDHITWKIPSQITINYNYNPNKLQFRHIEMSLDIQGKWNSGGGSYSTVVVEKGGALTIDKNDAPGQSVTFDNLTVKNGGTLNVNTLTYFQPDDVLNLEKGAVVNGNLYLDDGTLNSKGATINGCLDVSGNPEYDKNTINGDLTVDSLYVINPLTLNSNTKVHVKNSLDFSSDITLVIDRNTVIDYQRDWGSLFRGSIHIKSGGELDLRNCSMDEDFQITIDKGGILKADRLYFDNSSCKVKGNGKIYINQLNYNDAEFYSSAIASTITLEHSGECLEAKNNKTIKNNFIWSTCIACGKEMLLGSAPATPKPANPKVGTTFKVNGSTYKLTQVGKTRTAALTKAAKRATVSIPSKVTYKGKSYTVTSIGVKVFYNNKTIVTATVPSTVKTVGTQAFSGCTKLKKITGFTNVTSIGKQAFYNCSALTQIGSKSGTITLSKVQKIYNSAFQNCKKVTRFTITSKSLKSVGSKAISGINKKTVIRVPSSKLSTYKKLFKSSTGYVKSMKITK